MTGDHLPNWADRDEIRAVAEAIASYRDGRLDEDRFTAIRLQHGIYGQRQAGVYMVRVKIPGGRLTPPRLRALAQALRHYAQVNVASVTTRQDLQLHFVPLELVPKVLETLAEVGLTTREACGNTVRNFTACPLAGLCPHGHTDVGVHLEGAARHFLRHPLTQHLPRKMKVAFSACEADCAQGLMHDIGVVARWQGDQPGFTVLAAGGLGHKPRQAIVVESFIPEARLLPTLEALVALHHRYSDRRKRARSRLKFLVERFGEAGFLARYREELARLLPAYADAPVPRAPWRRGEAGAPDLRGAPRAPMRQQDGRWAVPVTLALGDVDAETLTGLADLMERHGLRELRLTQDQNLLLLGVDEASLEAVRAGLARLGLAAPMAGDDVVACPGTWTCRLGITDARALARVLDGGAEDLRIRVSGCHNGCAQPYVGDIGLHGEGRRLHGRLIPHYRLHLGGDGRLGGSFAVAGPEIPAARVGQAVARVQHAYRQRRREAEGFAAWVRREGTDFFAELLADLAEVRPEQLEEVLRDHGAEEAFRVLQLGGGECAGIAQETVAAAFAEARFEQGYRDTFRRKGEFRPVLEGNQAVLRLGAQGLLAALGETGADALEALARQLAAAAPVAEQARAFADLLRTSQGLAEGDWAAMDAFSAAVDRWLEAAREKAQRLDGQLHLDAVAGTAQTAPIADLSGERCPMHFVKARMFLRDLPAGERRGLRLMDEEAARVVGESLAGLGYQVERIERDGPHPVLWVTRARSESTLKKEAEA